MRLEAENCFHYVKKFSHGSAETCSILVSIPPGESWLGRVHKAKVKSK